MIKKVFFYDNDSDELVAIQNIEFEPWMDDIDFSTKCSESLSIWASDHGVNETDYLWELI